MKTARRTLAAGSSGEAAKVNKIYSSTTNNQDHAHINYSHSLSLGESYFQRLTSQEV